MPGLQPKIPYPQITVIATTDNLIISERQTCDGTSMANERGLAPSSLALPNLDITIMTAGDDPETVTVHGPHTLDVTKERLEWLAGLDIPYLDGVVERTGEKNGGGVRGRIRMGCEDVLLLSARRSAARVCVVAERSDWVW